jgi:hypothetical protein
MENYSAALPINTGSFGERSTTSSVNIAASDCKLFELIADVYASCALGEQLRLSSRLPEQGVIDDQCSSHMQ